MALTNADSQAKKKALRTLIRDRIEALPTGALHQEGEAAAQKLRASEPWQAFPAVLIFLSGSREIDTDPLLEGAMRDGKRIFAPKMEGDDIRFYRIQGFEDWQAGPFGIREPAETRGRTALEIETERALVVVPGAAFDWEGNRIGYGKGYYDRFFASIAQANRKYNFCYAGYCGGFQIVEQVPTDPWDVKMDALCTGQEFRIV